MVSLSISVMLVGNLLQSMSPISPTSQGEAWQYRGWSKDKKIVSFLSPDRKAKKLDNVYPQFYPPPTSFLHKLDNATTKIHNSFRCTYTWVKTIKTYTTQNTFCQQNASTVCRLPQSCPSHVLSQSKIEVVNIVLTISERKTTLERNERTEQISCHKQQNQQRNVQSSARPCKRGQKPSVLKKYLFSVYVSTFCTSH